MFWLVFSFLSLLFATLGDKNIIKNKKLNIFFQCLLIITLSIVVGLGGKIATDHDIYVQKYQLFSTIDTFEDLIDIIDFGIFFNVRDTLTETMSIGIAILNFLCFKIGISVPGYFLLIAFMTNTLLVKTLYRYKYPTLSLLIYITSVYFFQEFNLVRQYIAISLFVYSIKYIKENRLLPYCICISLAFIFHYSSIYLFPLFYLKKLTNKQNLLYYAQIAIIFTWVYSLLVALNLFQFKLNYSNLMFNYYEVYFINRDEKLTVNLMFNIFTFFMFYKLYRYGTKIRIDDILYVIGVILLNLSVQFYMLFRFALFFNFINCVYISSILSHSGQKYKLIFRFGMFLLYLYYGKILLNNFIFNDKALIGSKFYTTEELFRFLN